MFLNAYFEQEEQRVHLWDDKDGYSSFTYKDYGYIKSKSSVGTVFSIFGDPVKKIQRWKKEEEEKGNIFESDVPVLTRVLVDKYYETDDPPKNHHVVIIDMEVSSEGGFPDMIEADREIHAISLYDYANDKYYTWVLNRRDILTENMSEGNTVIEFVQTEEELLSNFFLKWTEIKPTIVTGWNTEKFDIPYLYRRSKKVLGDDVAKMLSPISLVEWKDFKDQYGIAGVSVLDYLGLYKKFTYTQESSYNLDAIGRKEVKMGKVKYEGSLDNLFKTDLKKFIEYNLTDVKIVKALDDKLKFIELVIFLCHKAHVPYEDVYYSSRVIDGAILSHLKRLKIVAPNKTFRSMDDANEEGIEQFSGAFVKEPVPGRYEWVFDLDMTSLYPSVIMSLNISPETKMGKVENWDMNKYISNQLGIVTFTSKDKRSRKMSRDELKEFLEQHGYSIAANGVVYNTDSMGLIPSILDEWFRERIEFKNLMKKYGKEKDHAKYEYFKHMQHVMKILLNSVYGVLGLPTFRFYDVDNAEATTTTGVQLIKFAEKMTNHFYNSELDTDDADYCIYIDTDSTFFSSLPIIKKRFPTADYTNEEFMMEKTLVIASEVQEYLNSLFILFAKRFLNVENHRFHIKQEVIAKSGLWVAKKRYAHWIINDNGVHVDKMEVKGLDTVRSNFPKAFKVLMREVLTMILKGASKDECDERVLSFKKSLYTLEVQDVAKPTSVKGIKKYSGEDGGTMLMKSGKNSMHEAIKGTPAHVKATINYNNMLVFLGLNKQYPPLYESEKIRWAYLKPNEMNYEAIAFRGYDDPPEILDFVKKYIDAEKIYIHELEGKVGDIYNAMNWAMPSESAKQFSKFFEL